MADPASDFPFTLDQKPTPQLVRDCMLTVARRTGAYRAAAIEVCEVLDRLCSNNAEKLCALSLAAAGAAGRETPGLRDLLLLAMPLIARELATQD